MRLLWSGVFKLQILVQTSAAGSLNVDLKGFCVSKVFYILGDVMVIQGIVMKIGD